MSESKDSKINDIKDRITRIESQAIGRLSEKSSTKDVWAYVVGAIGLFIAIVTLLNTMG